MSEPLADLREEAPRVLDAIRRRGLAVRAIGGLAVWLRCPSAREPPLAREYKDLDLVARAGATRELTTCLDELGYAADAEFNALHGRRRMMFWDPAHERQLDVFVDQMIMCHTLDLRDRLDTPGPALEPADLLLAKLQVVELNEKDAKDAAALLADHPLDDDDGLDARHIATLLAGDWGWWRTGTETLERVAAYAEAAPGFAGASRVRERADALQRRIEEEPKSRKWRMRAKIGERKRWYELPEEVEG